MDLDDKNQAYQSMYMLIFGEIQTNLQDMAVWTLCSLSFLSPFVSFEGFQMCETVK